MVKLKENKFDIYDLIQLIKEEGINSLHWVETSLFMISAKEFLAFAKKDISNKSPRGRVNALCNAKRAIENRIDILINNYALYYYSKKNRWTFPMKIEKLLEIDIKIPNVLQNMITSKRNLLEHEYVLPENQIVVEDIIDIAELFLMASEKYMKMNGVLKMINEPPESQYFARTVKESFVKGDRKKSLVENNMHRYFRDIGIRKSDPYVVFFDYKNEITIIYKKNWKKELKFKDIEEKAMIKLIKVIRNSNPSQETLYNIEEDISKFFELAEKMINKKSD